MAKLALRTPWTRQPQTPVGIDPKWIARGLAFAAIPGQAEYFSKKLPVQSGSSYLKVNPAGRAFSSPDTQIPGAYTYTVNIPSSFDNTVIVIVRSPVAQAASAAVPTLHFNSAESVFFSTTGSQSIYSTTGNASTTITTLTAGNVNALAGVKRVNSQEQYVNGVLATTNVTGNRAIGAITTVSVGRPSGGNNIDAVEYAGIFYFTKALSAGEIAELTRHYSKVWQVYQPIQRTIWVPAAGGGAGAQTLSPSSITSSEAFGTHVLSAGLVNLSPTAIASAEAFGSHTLSSIVALAPSGIATAEAFGTHVITVGGVTISPSGISSGEVFGSHIISQAGGTQTVLVNGIPSDEAFGSHLINAGTIIVTPTGIASQEGFGTASLLTGTVVIFPSGIPSGEVFGIPALVGGTPSGATTVFYVRGFSSYGQRRNR